MSNNLSYSTGALNVLNQFDQVDFEIFVEGKDDVLFWNYRFAEHTSLKYEITPVGCSEEILKKVKQVIDENAKIIIACDRDYTDFYSSITSHPRVVRTYGYSIENTMYCPVVLNDIVRKRLKLQSNDSIDDINSWYGEVVVAVSDLLHYDIASQVYELGVEVLGDKSAKFLKNHGKSINIDDEKVIRKISEVDDGFTKDQIEAIGSKVRGVPKEKRFLIRGHFLTHAIRNKLSVLIGSRGNKSFSDDIIYDQTVEACLKKCNCKDYEFLKNSIINAIQSLEFA